jgi:hypothetical protein
MADEAVPTSPSEAITPAGGEQDLPSATPPDVEAASTPAEDVVLRIGDISVSPHWVVTPTGTAALAGSEWQLIDSTRPYTKHPVWTIVLAIVLFPIGLLFLFVGKEEIRGPLEVKVKSAGLLHTAHLYTKNRVTAETIRKNFGLAESMAHALAHQSGGN